MQEDWLEVLSGQEQVAGDNTLDAPSECVTQGWPLSPETSDKASAEDPDCGAMPGTCHKSHFVLRAFPFSQILKLKHNFCLT